MPIDNPTIIAERSDAAAARRTVWIAGGLALLAGTAGALYYAAADLTLSHYDARGHLVVARRIIDSLTPGWRQIGAVWLPLPHVLNAVPVQWDWAYRSGASGAAISVIAMSAGVAAFAAYLLQHTRSSIAAIAAPLLLVANPNMLYLQATPMTEPLLIGLALIALYGVDAWCRLGRDRDRRLAGWALAAIVLTRYEGWLIAAALIGLAAIASGRSAVRLAAPPLLAIAAFLLLSRASTGAWFVASGFFVADNPSRGNAALVYADIMDATRDLAGSPLIWIGAAGAAACLWQARRVRAALLPLALLAAVALPFAAFFQGHPHRVRYMVPIVAALVAIAGAGLAGLPARARGTAAIVMLVIVAWSRPPLQADAPMVIEAQWETPWRSERREITRTLIERHDGTPILASMGSLGHYMQEVSSAGLTIADFLHEGNGDLWADALRWPRRHVRWILIEERAEGGDMLFGLARQDPQFLAGFDRIIESGGLVLYQRR